MLFPLAKVVFFTTLLYPLVFAEAPTFGRHPGGTFPGLALGALRFCRSKAHSHPEAYGDGCIHSPTSRHCWNGDFSIHTDMDLKWPDTGKIVQYDFEVSNLTLAPDGVDKEMIVVNGQFPGPTIVADWGDTVRVRVKNNLIQNGTGIHWHGVRQLGSNHMDGVGGITECPIAYNETRTYTFKATQFGTSWYHSHYSVQYSDGLVGGIIIRGPATSHYDVDLGVFPFMDWFHDPIFQVNARSLHATGPPTAQNLLINGSMTSKAGGKYAVTTVQQGKKYLLRLMNTGINNYVHVSLDAHPFEVIAADFTPIVPYTTTSISIAVGQRYDVIFTANQPAAEYWLHVTTGGGHCDGPNENAANIKSIFRYEGASGPPLDLGLPAQPTGCFDEWNLVPFIKTTVPEDTPENLTVGFQHTAGEENLVQWLLNGALFQVNLSMPTLQHVFDRNDEFDKSGNIFHVGKADEWSYWVIQQDNTSPAARIPHPVHLHGHDFFVLDWAENTTWSGNTSRLKFDNPIRRDTATLPSSGYLVVAFEADNPGVWLMHCHIPFHISAGFGLQFLERKDDIVDGLGDANGFKDGCKAWDTHARKYFPNGFTHGDSLVKM